MRYRSPMTVPGSKRPWSMPDDDSHPEGWVRGWFDGGRTDGVAPWRPSGAIVSASMKSVGRSANATGVAQCGQNRAVSDRGCLQDVHAATGGL